MYMYIYIYIYIHIVCMYAYIHLYMCIYIYIYVCYPKASQLGVAAADPAEAMIMNVISISINFMNCITFI